MDGLRALVVEDEKRLAETVGDLLRMDGYITDICHDGESGLDNALSGIYDVCVLDIMLPKLDGFEVLRRLRREGSGLPVLLLTARSDVADRVRGLDSGADYYLSKPFEPKELVACVRALTRRQPEIRETSVIEYGDLKLDKNGLLLKRGEREIRLSRKEYSLMELLMLNRERALDKETMLLKVWGYESDADENSVEVYISFLRRKLEHLRSNVHIRTIRMVGYCLEKGEDNN